jgi:hypothetical protein
MVMAMLLRILNYRSSMMGFMVIGRYENRIGAMVRTTTGVGASGYDKRHINAQHSER